VLNKVWLLSSVIKTSNYDGIITVLKQSAYRSIILAKILSYASRAGFQT